MKSENKMNLESQDDIAYLTGKRSPEERKKQIKYDPRCPLCGKLVPIGATHCQNCGAEISNSGMD